MIMRASFCQNLRFLTSFYPSIADVCRRIGINRQQFNKYLNGYSQPSASNLKKICDFFGVEDFEINLPHEDFKEIINGKPQEEAISISFVGQSSLQALFEDKVKELGRYCGFYYSYRYSFSEPHLILKSLILLQELDGVVISKRFERFTEDGNQEEFTSVSKYHGYVTLLHDRVFIVEAGRLKEEEIGETILYPSFRNQTLWLSGLHTGVSTRDDRRIGSAQVLFQYLGRSGDRYEMLKGCGRFSLTDKNIPTKVQNYFSRDDVYNSTQSALIFAEPL